MFQEIRNEYNELNKPGIGSMKVTLSTMNSAFYYVCKGVVSLFTYLRNEVNFYEIIKIFPNKVIAYYLFADIWSV